MYPVTLVHQRDDCSAQSGVNKHRGVVGPAPAVTPIARSPVCLIIFIRPVSSLVMKTDKQACLYQQYVINLSHYPCCYQLGCVSYDNRDLHGLWNVSSVLRVQMGSMFVV